ncbi:MAG: HEAT repeat domain-containing protein [Planctomycetes bacterium]|nr:HEAT repeat domain-containing protein [Planctomycetota bacterium]MBI3847376.1 HEAT repeat domain-containing protein [Planctomycetota bacterium]
MNAIRLATMMSLSVLGGFSSARAQCPPMPSRPVPPPYVKPLPAKPNAGVTPKTEAGAAPAPTPEPTSWWGLWARVGAPYVFDRIAATEPTTSAADFLLGRSGGRSAPTRVALVPRAAADASISALLDALTDPSAEVRAAAAIAVGRAGDPFVRARLERSLSDSNDRVCASATLGLGMMGVNDEADALRHLLADDVAGRRLARRESVPTAARASAARALGFLRDASSSGALIAVLTGRGSGAQDDVALAALEALGSIDSDASTSALVGIASSGGQSDVRRASALESLGRRGARAGLPLAMRALRDGGRESARSAALALGRLVSSADSRVVAEIGVLAERHDRDPITRGIACLALGALGGRDAQEILGRVIQRDRSDAAQFSAIALGFLARTTTPTVTAMGETATSILLASMASADQRGADFRAAVALALGLARAHDAEEELHVMLNSPGDKLVRVRGSAAIALGLLGSHVAVPDIAALTRRCGIEQLPQCGVGLALLSRRQSAAEIEARLFSAETDVERVAAVATLGSIRSLDSVPVLVAAARDRSSSESLRSAAISALGRIVDARTIPIVVSSNSVDSTMERAVSDLLSRL